MPKGIRMRAPFATTIRKMEPSLATLLILTVGAVAVVGLLLAVTAPTGLLVGDTQWHYISAFHGLGATMFLLGATIAVYLSWRLFIGEIKAFDDLKWLTTFSAVMAAVTIAFGNWIYIAYRAPGGPRSYFLETLPEIHAVFFEFKEFIALFTLPTMVASTFLIWKYGPALKGNPELRAAASITFLLGWAFLLLAYILGAAITKLNEVG